MKDEKIVLKVGGSLLFNDDKTINTTRISELVDIFRNGKTNEPIVIICGGGLIAREYIDVVRAFNPSEAFCDLFGIEISRLNAKLIISAFKDLAYPQVPKTLEELSRALLFKKIIVMGGLQPGQSTTSVALEVAEFTGTNKLIILTDVKGIYNKDPKKFKDAKLLHRLSYEKLLELIINKSSLTQASAGEYRIFDAVSLQILKRSNIKVYMMSGIDLNEFKKFLNGQEDIIGTIISRE